MFVVLQRRCDYRIDLSRLIHCSLRMVWTPRTLVNIEIEGPEFGSDVVCPCLVLGQVDEIDSEGLRIDGWWILAGRFWIIAEDAVRCFKCFKSDNILRTK
jgi:hypothetical protein